MIEKALAELTLNITDGKHGDCRGKDDSGYYFISCKDIREGQIHYEDARQIIEEDFWDAHKRTRLEPDDILVTNSGTIGRMAFVRDVPLTYRTTFQKSVAIVKPDKAKIFPKYLYYQLQNCVDDFINRSNGAAQKNLLLSTMRAFKMNIHEDEDLQMHIAAILSAYDDLIENNQKQIKLLEEAAQRLYKEWFVDLRFPGHETTPIVDGVPEGWKVDRADTFFNMSIGKTPPRAEKQWFTDGDKGTPWISISDMGNSGTYVFHTTEGLTAEAITKHNVRVVPTDTILVSFKLTVGRVSITTTSTCTNEAIAHFLIPDSFLREYTYLYLKCFEYDSLGNTSAISKAVNSKIIKAMPFVMPDSEILQRFHQVGKPILEEIKNKQKTNICLAEARDRMLPKLMSGEIEV